MNGLAPPDVESFGSNEGSTFEVILVASRWDYGSRFNGDGFEYRRFLPALRNVARSVLFVPIEAKTTVTLRVRRVARSGGQTIALSVFNNPNEIPRDYFELAEEGVYLANWYTDDDMLFDRFSKHVGNRFHLNITTYEANLPRYRAISANAVASQWAGIDGCGFLESRRYAACFVGRMYGQRAILAKRLRKEFGGNVFVHDTRVRPINDEVMISAYQNSWLAIDDPLAYDGKTLQIKARVFENASMGCVVATQPNERLHRYYDPDKEILFWETPVDLMATVHDCIGNPEPYRRMARAAYDRTQREHLYEHRFQEIFRQIMQQRRAFS